MPVTEAEALRVEYQASLDGREWFALPSVDVNLRAQYQAPNFGDERARFAGPAHFTTTIRIPDVRLVEATRRFADFFRGILRPGARFVLQLVGDGHVFQRNGFFVTHTTFDHARLEWRLEAEGIPEVEVVAVRPDPVEETVETWARTEQVMLRAIERQMGELQRQAYADFFAPRILQHQIVAFGFGVGGAPSKEAEVKAKELLFKYLTPAQRADYEKTGTFVVQAKSGREYVFGRCGSWVIRIYERDERTPWQKVQRALGRKLCIGPAWHESYPKGDVLLAQKLLLEADEKRFLQNANDMGEVLA